MKNSESKGKSLQNWLDEPENYAEVRSDLFALMSDLKQCKDKLSKLNNLGIVQEYFQEPVRTSVSSISDTIYLLGKINGFTLADDVLEVEGFAEDLAK